MKRLFVDRPSLLTCAAFFMVTLLVTLAPIRSYDAFWHLATGRWIVEHRALPLFDPFATGSDRVPWINGSWLFQVALYGLYLLGGLTAICIARALLIATLFSGLAAWAMRRLTPAAAAALAAVSLLGATLRLGARPETVGLALLALFLIVLLETGGWRRLLTLLAVTIVWINVHPSALLAPALTALVAAGTLLEQRRWNRQATEEAICSIACAVALLLNPFGLSGVLAPLRLAGQVTSGAFVNAEWLPSRPATFPLLYLIIVIIGALIVARRFRFLPGVLLYLFFALLAMRYVRNQGFFFVAVAIAAVWWLPARLTDRVNALVRIALLTTVIGLLAIRLAHPPRLGTDPKYFPVHAVSRLKALALPGNFYNPDQFGGFLIWSFYPERRALTDGRNELYREYLQEYAAARTNSRAWVALLRRHQVDLAVEEYRREPMTAVDATTGLQRRIAPSIVLYPRSSWALIAFDDAAMIFVRRAAFPPQQLERVEYRTFRPDDWTPIDAARAPAVRVELARARQEIGDATVLRNLEERLVR